jgi:hypothetical protein
MKKKLMIIGGIATLVVAIAGAYKLVSKMKERV